MVHCNNIFVHRHNFQTERSDVNANAAFIWSKERGKMAAFFTTVMTSLSVEDMSKLPQFDEFALSFITLDGPNCTVILLPTHGFEFPLGY